MGGESWLEYWIRIPAVYYLNDQILHTNKVTDLLKYTELNILTFQLQYVDIFKTKPQA